MEHCPRFGPIYLLQENFCEQLKQSKKLSNDGHHFVTASGDLVAFTRCWDWCKGFRGDVANRARDATQMLRSLPDAVADACWAAKSISSSSNGNEGPSGPAPEELLRYAEDAIADNLYERIMEAVHASRHYSGMTRDAVLDLIPRGLCLSSTQPGYLSCRHCISKSTGTNVDFPTSVGIKSHFLGRKRQSNHSCHSFLQHLLEQQQGQAEAGLPEQQHRAFEGHRLKNKPRAAKTALRESPPCKAPDSTAMSIDREYKDLEEDMRASSCKPPIQVSVCKSPSRSGCRGHAIGILILHPRQAQLQNNRLQTALPCQSTGNIRTWKRTCRASSCKPPIQVSVRKSPSRSGCRGHAIGIPILHPRQVQKTWRRWDCVIRLLKRRLVRTMSVNWFGSANPHTLLNSSVRFAACKEINECKSKTGMTWPIFLSARLVRNAEGRVVVATGERQSYEELRRGTMLMGGAGAVFKKMWEVPSMKAKFRSREEFLVLTHSLKAVYDNTAREAGVRNRMIMYYNIYRHSCRPA